MEQRRGPVLQQPRRVHEGALVPLAAGPVAVQPSAARRWATTAPLGERPTRVRCTPQGDKNWTRGPWSGPALPNKEERKVMNLPGGEQPEHAGGPTHTDGAQTQPPRGPRGQRIRTDP